MDLIGRWPHMFGPFGFIFRVIMLLCQWPSNGCRDLHIAKLTNNVFMPSSQDLIILVRYMFVMFCCFLWFCTIHSKSHLSWTWFSFESHLYHRSLKLCPFQYSIESKWNKVGSMWIKWLVEYYSKILTYYKPKKESPS